jgi:hypothetical protein
MTASRTTASTSCGTNRLDCDARVRPSCISSRRAKRLGTRRRRVAVPQTVTGYVTQEKFLLGKTPAQIEEALGVRVNPLGAGCIVLALLSVPGPSMIDYELTTNYPDGLAPSVLSDPNYAAFSTRYVHQWRLRVPMRASFVCRLGPGESYKSVSR